MVLPVNGQAFQPPAGKPVATGRSDGRPLRAQLHLGLFLFLFFPGQVAHPDGDFRLTIVDSSVLDRPRALVLVPQEG